jgi:hypothetical protein
VPDERGRVGVSAYEDAPAPPRCSTQDSCSSPGWGALEATMRSLNRLSTFDRACGGRGEGVEGE